MNTGGGITNQNAVANLYHINERRAIQINRSGIIRNNGVDPTVYGAR